MFNTIKKSLNSLGEALDRHYDKQLEKGKSSKPFGLVSDDEVLVRGRDGRVENTKPSSGSEPYIEVGCYRGNVQAQYGYNAPPESTALKLLENNVSTFSKRVMNEYNTNNGFVRLMVFHVDKSETFELSNLSWSTMLDFSRNNKVIVNLKNCCEQGGVHCFVKEKAGKLTIICSSDENAYKAKVNQLLESYSF